MITGVFGSAVCFILANASARQVAGSAGMFALMAAAANSCADRAAGCPDISSV